MKHFTSIEKLDMGILYALELGSSLSVLLLAFGLIASMANVLTKGAVLTDNIVMQRIWAWTQCIAIDASVAGTVIRTFSCYREGEKVKTWLYGFLSVLLLFTAAIVSNIESIQQTLNLTLDHAYAHVFLPVEALIWIRSIAIVLLIVAHAMKHVQMARSRPVPPTEPLQQHAPSLVLTSELVETLRVLQEQTIASDSALQVLAQPKTQGPATHEPVTGTEEDLSPGNFERVRHYLAEHPDAKVREVAAALTISVSTADKWMVRVKGRCL